MKTNDELNDLGPERVVTVTLLREELAQLRMLLDKVRKHAGRSVWWAQFVPLLETLRHRFDQEPRVDPRELRPAHWLNFFVGDGSDRQ